MKKATKKDCETMAENLDDAKGALELIKKVLEDKLNNHPKWPDPESFTTAFDSHTREIRKILENYGIFTFEEHSFELDGNGFIEFGSLSRRVMKKQCQYGSRYIDGKLDDYPNLGEGLRFEGDTSDYHFIKIHKDDVTEFIKRVREYQSQYT
ncbi:hypothetical protein HON36_01025 [Candidatus Parcubacteria bacterium]|jgi:hypothetical protein|nr:hypothetical protein [Candidatus Parcubacteria bacterium]MBT7228223.1 hypothetical protein [Candidatus Parcubacteria bacterium]